jgi:ribosomal protein S18 acetylase RimI-like enzyme
MRELPLEAFAQKRTAAPTEIRMLESHDLPAVAQIHHRAFPTAAVSQLGHAAALRFYRSLTSGAHEAVGLGVFHCGALVAFGYGGVWHNPEALFLRQNLSFVAGRLMMRPALVMQPFIRDRILTGFRLLWPQRREAPAASEPAPKGDDVRSFGILYLAVDPIFQRRGFGRALMAEFERIAREQGYDEMDLSVYLDNHPAISFYRNDGWQPVGEGEWRGFMRKSLVVTPRDRTPAETHRARRDPSAAAVMTIQRLRRDDLPHVARVHCAAFPQAAISRLGQEAVRRYYEALMNGPHETVGLAAFEADGELRGFCFVGVRHEAESAYLRQNLVFVLGRIARKPWLLLDSFFFNRLLSGVRLLLPRRERRPAHVAMPVDSPPPRPSYGIQVIMIDPAHQRKGYGKRLMEAAEQFAATRGHDYIELSVFTDNAKAISFYEKTGWKRKIRNERWDGLMSKQLESQKPVTRFSEIGNRG